ncbi:MAG TPA: PQQ-binding-like beta-propeller repeat protein [Bryobacteraceae bacterium]|nr:PQQ-binding-like beta-propeller repeat protein [Bryobacteraceae bacterium]
MRSTWILLLAGTLAIPALLSAETKKSVPGDWPMYTHDLAGTRFSNLNQINTENVSKLAPAWSYRLTAPAPARGRGPARGGPAASGGRGAARGGRAGGRGGRGGGGNPEATPIVVNGMMYLPAGNRILALDPDTGKEIWTATLDTNTAARGVAYWPGDKNNPPRIVFTAGKFLNALNANTGKVDPGFGKEGKVEINVPWSGVPTIYQNVIMLGASVGEIPKGPPGDTRAYDAVTGKHLWDFHTVPRPGEPGFGSWEGDSWKNFSGVNVWGWYMTVDAQRGILYMPLGSPAGNYYGGERPGNDLFGNSVVAVNAKTGKYLWHFQTVHHDLWDSDLPPAPVLLDIRKNGKKIPALADIGKPALMFILDRTTGKPVFGVEERKVPKGDVPGEWYSPTQPFPLKPPPLARNTFNKSTDMVTADETSEDHVKACEALWDKSGGFYSAGPYTPFLFHADGAPPKSTMQWPGNGGPNWGGMAADPKTGYIYLQTHDAALVGWIEKKRPGGNYGSGNGSPQLYDRGSVNGPGPYFSFSAPMKGVNGRTVNLPCQRPPWARLIAVNANTGDIAWETTLGINEALPAGKQDVGGAGSAGPIVTAGGLVFIGATTDSRFRAFDAKTGKELWETKLDRTANANPMTYRGKDGKQYVAVIATDTVRVFALP